MSWLAGTLLWTAYILTTYAIEHVIKPIPHKLAGLAGIAALTFLFGVYAAATAIIATG